MNPEFVALRAEIVANHVLAHWLTLASAVVMLIGVWVVGRRPQVLAAFLPLFGLAWAAAIVRIDFFIHRAGAYIRTIESGSVSALGWENWKASLKLTPILLPPADLIAVLPIVAPALYLAFGPGRAFLRQSSVPFAAIYPWIVAIGMVGLLLLLPFVPQLAAWR